MSHADQEIRSKPSKYLKIEEGAPQDIRLMDESPTVVMKHQAEKGQVMCKGEDCEICEQGEDPMQKFITNVYNHNIQKVMLWEYGTGVAKKIKSIAQTLAEEQSDILKVDLKVEATGSGMQKRYNVTPRVNSKVVPDGLGRYTIEVEG